MRAAELRRPDWKCPLCHRGRMVIGLTMGKKLRIPFWTCDDCGYNEEATFAEYKTWRRTVRC